MIVFLSIHRWTVPMCVRAFVGKSPYSIVDSILFCGLVGGSAILIFCNYSEMLQAASTIEKQRRRTRWKRLKSKAQFVAVAAAAAVVGFHLQLQSAATAAATKDSADWICLQPNLTAAQLCCVCVCVRAMLWACRLSTAKISKKYIANLHTHSCTHIPTHTPTHGAARGTAAIATRLTKHSNMILITMTRSVAIAVAVANAGPNLCHKTTRHWPRSAFFLAPSPFCLPVPLRYAPHLYSHSGRKRRLSSRENTGGKGTSDKCKIRASESRKTTTTTAGRNAWSTQIAFSRMTNVS